MGVHLVLSATLCFAVEPSHKLLNLSFTEGHVGCFQSFAASNRHVLAQGLQGLAEDICGVTSREHNDCPKAI